MQTSRIPGNLVKFAHMEGLQNEMGPNPPMRPVIEWRGKRYYGEIHALIVNEIEDEHPELMVNGSLPDEIYEELDSLHGFELSPDLPVVHDRNEAFELARKMGLLEHLSQAEMERVKKTGLHSQYLLQ